MTKKKGVLLIIVALAVLTLASVLVVQKLKKDEVAVMNNNENVNQNVNIETEKEPEIIDGVDISDWKTYRNEEYGYSVRYPNDRIIHKFDLNTGASFIKDNDHIVIEVSGKNTINPNIDFIDYVKRAAINDIENYEELNSLQEFTTITGDKGYRTNWKIKRGDEYIISKDIVYFEARKNGAYESVLSIVLRYGLEYNENYSKIFDIMSKTFNYID